MRETTRKMENDRERKITTKRKMSMLKREKVWQRDDEMKEKENER